MSSKRRRNFLRAKIAALPENRNVAVADLPYSDWPDYWQYRKTVMNGVAALMAKYERQPDSGGTMRAESDSEEPVSKT